MNPTTLRLFAKRYGAFGYCIVGFVLLTRHLCKRYPLVSATVILAAAACIIACNMQSHVESNGHRLYVATGEIAQTAPRQIAADILHYWDEGSITEDAKRLAQEFEQAVNQRDRTRAIAIGNKLKVMYHANPNWSQDGKWLFCAELGGIYLQEAWLDDAEREFRGVLAAIKPRRDQIRMGSVARQISAYGLARVCALRGSYTDALKWQADAPTEYSSGCGNANDAEEMNHFPELAVWNVACKPYPAATRELEAVMSGRFSPMASQFNQDTSGDQTKHAALEAGLVLGCLYKASGKDADADICWNLVASHSGSNEDVGLITGAMLYQLRHKP